MRVPFRAGRTKFLPLALWCACVAGLEHQLPRHPYDTALEAAPPLLMGTTIDPTPLHPMAFRQTSLEPEEAPAR